MSNEVVSSGFPDQHLFHSVSMPVPTHPQPIEAALQHERQLVSAVLDIVGALVVVLDREGRIVRFNRACERVTGYRFEEIKDRPLWEFLLLPAEIAPVRRIFETLRAGDFPLDFENHWVTRDGRQRLIAWSNTVLTAADGTVEYIIGTGIDITERRQAEQEIKHMSSFPLLNPNPVLEVDLAGQLVFCNPGTLETLRQLGCEPDALLFLPADFAAIVGEFEQPAVSLLYREVALGAAIFAEHISCHSDFGTIRIFATNITERKRAEEQLRYQAFLLENVSDAIVASDVNFMIQSWNKAAEELYGWQAAEVIGKSVTEILRGEFAVPVADTTHQLFTEGSWKGEVIHWCKDGRRVPVLAAVRLLRDEAGQPIGAVSVNRDITERKQMEEALRQSNIELQARNVELDAFAHTVAHDIKNPLHLIIGYAGVLIESYPALSSDEALHSLQLIERSGEKLNSITDNLLLLSQVHQQDIIRTPLEMAAIVAEARQRVAHLIDTQTCLSVPAAWPTALGYEPWLEEVWVNLLSNALKYAGRPACIELGGERQADDLLRFWVRDNGPGIAPANQARLFEAFYQVAARQGSGHGLGLSIVKRIVEKLGGEVSVQSSGVPGEGACFSFTLPAA
jgi:PAS domain S-box-containing protein